MKTYISHALNYRTLEVCLIEFLHGGFQVCRALKFNKSTALISSHSTTRSPRSPFAISLTANFRVHDLEARAAREIFQVLRSQVSPSP